MDPLISFCGFPLAAGVVGLAVGEVAHNPKLSFASFIGGTCAVAAGTFIMGLDPYLGPGVGQEVGKWTMTLGFTLIGFAGGQLARAEQGRRR
jgi:hypothetical protein